jgi:hypothetical protein
MPLASRIEPLALVPCTVTVIVPLWFPVPATVPWNVVVAGAVLVGVVGDDADPPPHAVNAMLMTMISGARFTVLRMRSAPRPDNGQIRAIGEIHCRRG